MAEAKKIYGSNAAARVIYAPSTSGALAYAPEPAYRSTRLAAAQPQRKKMPAAVPAPKPQKPIAVPEPKTRRVPLSKQLSDNHAGTKAFIFSCVGLVALMGIMMLFNCKIISDTQSEINKTVKEINKMQLRLGEINMNYRCSLDETVAGFTAGRASMPINIP